MANLKPLKDQLIIETVEEERTAAGIIIPDSAKEKSQKGRVVAVGPGRTDDSGNRIPMGVKEGDVVIYSKYAPTELKIEGKDLMILAENDVLAVVE